MYHSATVKHVWGKNIYLNNASTVIRYSNFKLLICKIRRLVLGFFRGREEWGIVLPRSNSERSDLRFEAEMSFCQKRYGWESIWLISQREICKPVFKLDFTAHGIMSPSQRWCDMNGRFQVLGGKNSILPKELNANRFFWDSHSLAGNLVKPLIFSPSMGPNRMEGLWLWTQHLGTVFSWRGLVNSFQIILIKNNTKRKINVLPMHT